MTESRRFLLEWISKGVLENAKFNYGKGKVQKKSFGVKNYPYDKGWNGWKNDINDFHHIDFSSLFKPHWRGSFSLRIIFLNFSSAILEFGIL